MDDERQDQDSEEVEAHRLRNAPPEDPGRSALDEEDDEVEAHRLRNSPSERPMNRPMNEPSE